LSDVQRVSDTVAILNHGSLVAAGPARGRQNCARVARRYAPDEKANRGSMVARSGGDGRWDPHWHRAGVGPTRASAA
jgi:ABC-type multidrug transport system ATPase subunit